MSAKFRYTGIAGGRKVSGAREAESREELRAWLREQGILPMEIRPQRTSGRGPRRRTAIERALTPWFVGMASVEQAFMQMTVLLRGDVAVAEALETVAGLSKGYLAHAFFEASQAVRGGAALTKALRAAMPWMGELYLGLIGVGEANGALPQMFDYCVGLMERHRKLRSDVLRAMAYPMVVVLMGMGVGYYVSTVAIPKIVSVMGDASRLPPITRSLLDVSDWVRLHGYWLMLGPAMAAMAVAVTRRVPGLGVGIDRLLLSMPLFGKVGRFAGNALFNHTLSLLLDSGISVTESLALIRGTLTNAFYRRQMELSREGVLSGKALSESLGATALSWLSPLTRALARVGESSGNMVDGLRYAGDHYAQALARRLDLLGKLVEPALVIVIGGMVAYVYIAFFMGMAAMNAAAS